MARVQILSKEDQNIANNSKRLIQNAIILWNYLYITKKLQQAKTQAEKENILQALKNSSIIYYKFLNFFGTYDFTSYSKRVYNLIAIDEEKEFFQPIQIWELFFCFNKNTGAIFIKTPKIAHLKNFYVRFCTFVYL